MLIDSKQAQARLESKDNLINRLRSNPNKADAMKLFGVGKANDSSSSRSNILSIPQKPEPVTANEMAIAVKSMSDEQTEQVENNEALISEVIYGIPTIDELIDDPSKRIKIQDIHDRALDVLGSAMEEIKRKLPDVQKVEKLADVAAKMNKIVTDIRNDKNKTSENDKSIHYHFYTPERKQLSDFTEVTV